MHVDGERAGFFLTIEGPDGSGKSWQAERLGARLEAAGLACLVTREPGGTALGERVREIVLHAFELNPTTPAETLLFSAARAQHAEEIIRPALARGAIVVCDRFADSTLAYQGYGLGAPLDVLRTITRFAVGDLRPDLTILIDLPVEDGLARKTRDERDGEMTRFEAARDVAYHERVRAGFLALAAAEPERWAVVDGRPEPAAVETAILSALLPRLPAASQDAILRSAASEPQRARARMD